MEFSRRLCRSFEECRRRRTVLPSPGKELDGEAVLATVPGTGASGAVEQPDEATGGAASDVRLGDEGHHSPALGSQTHSEQLLWLGEATHRCVALS